MGWLTGWSKRQAITLTGGSDGAQTDFQLKLSIAYDSDMLSDFSDLRFTQADGETLIDAWLEDKTDGVSADVWVEFPTTPANGDTQTYYMYYGKADALDKWDIGATFLFGDDFPGTSFDAQWTSVDAQWSVSDGNAVHTVTDAGTWDQLAAANAVVDGVLTAKIKISNDGASHDELGIFVRSDGTYADADVIQFISRPDMPDFTNLNYATGEGTCANAIDYDTWHYLKVIFDGADIKTSYSTDGDSFTDCQSYTTTHTTEDDIGFRAIDSTSYVDWVHVRKYAANPPTYGFGSEENAPTGLSMVVVMHHLMQMRRS